MIGATIVKGRITYHDNDLPEEFPEWASHFLYFAVVESWLQRLIIQEIINITGQTINKEKKSDKNSMTTGVVLRGRSYLYSGSLVYFVQYLTEQQLSVKLYAVTLMDTTVIDSMSGFFDNIFLAQWFCFDRANKLTTVQMTAIESNTINSCDTMISALMLWTDASSNVSFNSSGLWSGLAM